MQIMRSSATAEDVLVAMRQSLSPITPAESFSPEVLDMMSDAFEIAWTFVERSSQPSSTERSGIREVLARHIVMSAKLGETSKVRLANFAIGRLRADTEPGRGRT
jgi:hypothetical protein